MRTELDVPFSHKEEAKALGAKWDRTKKVWYVPSGVNPEPFAEWLPGVDRSDPSAPYIYLVLGKRECWKCHKETSVAAFGIPYRTDNDESVAIAHAPNESGHIAIDTANANARISARLPYLLNASRFAHYVKANMRDKVGSFMTADNVSKYLNNWISQYVLLSDDAGDDIKARYPLREARVDVSEDPGNPGAYKCVIFLRPHFQLEELTASIRLVAELPPPAV